MKLSTHMMNTNVPVQTKIQLKHFAEAKKSACWKRDFVISDEVWIFQLISWIVQDRVDVGFSCTNFLRSIVVLVFAIISALHNFRSYSFRNKMINLVLLIKYRFDFRLQFDINKKCIFEGFTEILLNNGTYNYMT